MHGATTVALRPATLRGQPVAGVAALPNGRPLSLGCQGEKTKLQQDQSDEAPTADSGLDSVKEQRLDPRGWRSQQPRAPTSS